MKKILSLLLAICLCVSLSAVAFASNTIGISYEAEINGGNATIYRSDVDQTVTVRVDADSEFTFVSIGGSVEVPDGFEVVSITHDSISFVTSQGKDKFSYFNMGMTEQNTDNVCILTLRVPANTGAGKYKVGIKDLEIAKNNGQDIWERGGSAYATLTIAEAPVHVTSVTLNKDTLNLTVGNYETLTATVEPENADDKNVTWSSSDPTVATVDENGKVTAVKAGNAVITATAGGKKATCEVTVTSQPVPVTGISLDDAEVSVGRTIQLKPKFTPADTTQRGVTWASSDETIATVDANGNIKGLAEGTVSITVTSTENANVTATCTVTVTKKNDDTVWAGGSAIVGGFGDDGVIFKDVSFRNYYYDAVKWAVDRDITSGTSRYTFSPDAVCTRAQTVTFLWRAAGCPKAENRNNPFTDVHTGDYFYEAVLWAVESGITNGTSAATFSPDATVSRAQVVTFLWRAEGQPDAAASGFTDVSANAYYAKAVDWAFACGITTGMDYGTFGADAECTRAQIVTFLYRSAR